MATPFLSEIKIISFNFPPKGWAFCNGQFLPIMQNQALFSLLGTTYGGNGQTTFALPNLQGRVPIHMGSGFTLGQSGGEQAHTLSIAEIPRHTHTLNHSTSAASTNTPAANTALGDQAQEDIYREAAGGGLTAMTAGTIANVGGSQAHNNMQPYLALYFIIALQGIFPSQN